MNTELDVWATLLGLTAISTDPFLFKLPRYTVKEYMEAVRLYNLLDFDGHGYWAVNDYYLASPVYPSRLGNNQPPHWATHILWTWGYHAR